MKTSLVPSTPPRTIKDWHCLGVLTLIVLFFFRKILFGDAYLWEDFIYYYYPTKNFAATSLASGTLPLWNPYTFGGMPFLADIQNAVFYPPNLLLAIFSNDVLHFIYVEYSIVLHLLLGGVGMFYLARYLKLERLPSLFSGIAFMLCGHLVTHVIHQTVISGVVWLPLITLFMLKALRGQRMLDWSIAAIVLSLSVLAGFPQVSLYTFFFVGCLVLFELFTAVKIADRKVKEAARMSMTAAAIFLLALGMTAVQLLPTIELAPLSNRAAISYEQSLVGSLTGGQVITLAVPKFFGASNAQAYNYWGPESYWHYWETCIYVGIPTLVLFLLSLPYQRREPFWIFLTAIGLFSILAALGEGFVLHKLLFHYAPGFDKFRNPGRFTMLFAFVGPLIAGMGLNHLLYNKDFFLNRRKTLLLAGAIPGVTAVLYLMLQGKLLHSSFNFLKTPQAEQFVSSEISTALVISVVMFLIVFGVSRGQLSKTVAGTAAVLLIFIDLYIFGFSQNNGRTNPLEYFQRSQPIIQNLLREGEKELFRVSARQGGYMVFDRNQGMMDNIFLLEGYTPLGLARLWPPALSAEDQLDLLNVKYAIHVDEQQRTMGLRLRSDYMPRAWVVYAARVVGSENELEAFMKSPEFNFRRHVVIERKPVVPIPEFSTKEFHPVQVLSYESDRIVMKTSLEQPAMLVLSEIYYPGWVAMVNGAEREIVRANGTLRAVELDSGEQHVAFEFTPASFRQGAWISLTTLALSCGIAYFSTRSIRKRRIAKQKNNEQPNG